MSLVEHKFEVDYTAQMRKYYVTVKNWHKIRRRPMEVLLATHDLTTRMSAMEYNVFLPPSRPLNLHALY